MITPILEKLILKGEGTFKTFSLFYSPTGRIIVPRDRFIVITDIIITPGNHLSNPQDEAGVFKNVDKFSITQLDLFSKGIERNTYLVKNQFELLITNEGYKYVKNSEPVHFNVLQTAKNDLYMSVLRFAGVDDAMSQDISQLSNTQIPVEPTSYGDTITTLKTLVTEDGMHYSPMGVAEFGGLTTNQYSTGTAKVTSSGLSPIPMITPGNNLNNNCHMVHVSYVEMNLQVLQNLG